MPPSHRPNQFDLDAQISPDGRWIAYEHDTSENGTIRLVRPNGRDDHVIDVGCVDPCLAASSPTWISNERLAFGLLRGPFDPVTGAAASNALYTARIDGTDRRRLSPLSIDGVYEDSYLRVSPDHKYLTFRRTRNSDSRAALFRMVRRSGALRQLTPYGLNAEVNDLSTAEHGRTKDLLVFESYGRGDPSRTFADIATVPTTCRSLADCTSKIHWITDNAATGRRNANPQWSPDGTSLVFTDRPSIDDPNAEIWTMRYPSSPRHKISTSQDFDFRPAWAPTGKATATAARAFRWPPAWRPGSGVAGRGSLSCSRATRYRTSATAWPADPNESYRTRACPAGVAGGSPWRTALTGRERPPDPGPATAAAAPGGWPGRNPR